MNSRVILLSLILAFSSVSGAEKMDLSTHDLLIQKLERVLNALDDQDVSRQGLILRLADLHAERARLLDMDDGAKGSEQNKAQTRKDRASAIELYQQAFKTVSKDKQGPILIQMAHLHELQGELEKAQGLYKDVTKKPKAYAPDLLGQAYTGLGDISFQKAHYREALKQFQSAYAIKQSPRRGYVLYRIAWCQFHEGNQQVAQDTMVRLLNSPELLKKKTDGSLDTAFQEESSRDLATFMARGGVNGRDIQALMKSSPESTRTQNLTYLATELDRTGKKGDALKVWAVIGQREQSGQDKLEGQIKIAQIKYDIGKKPDTVVEFTKTVNLWKEEGCDDKENCEVLRQQIRKIVTDWGKAEEREPSIYLIQAYTAYLSVFPDIEVNYWAALSAHKIKKFNEASRFYRQASDLAHEFLGQTKNTQNRDRITKIFEGALLGEIEVAELSKDPTLRDQAYAHYLKLNPNGEKSVEVRYQMAQLLSEKGQTREAADAFHAIALSQSKFSADLREKSADLALDNLVLAKDDVLLEDWALEFAAHFPARKADFQKIARKSVLNQAATEINSASPSTRKLEKNFEKLSKMDLSAASQNEKVNVYKHRILIGEKLQNVDAIDSAAAAILKTNGITQNERDEALSRRAWASELRLDFDQALKFQQQIKNPSLSLDQYTLKLAVLAELAGRNPSAYYEKYMSLGKDKAKVQWAAFKLVTLARNPTSELKHVAYVLKQNPELFAKAVVAIFSKTGDLRLAREALQTKGVSTTASGRTLSRFIFIDHFHSLEGDIAHHRLQTNSEGALKTSLRQRLKLMNQIEIAANQAIERGDWTLQAVTLSRLASENSRLAQDIQRMPVPRGLKRAQKDQYRALLVSQSAPYTEKARAIAVKIDELWKATEYLKGLVELASRPSVDDARIAEKELKIVTALAKKTGHTTSVSLRIEKGGKDLVAAAHEAKAQVQKNPFNVRSIEKLKEIETKMGRGSMVAYLEGRITELQGGRN